MIDQGPGRTTDAKALAFLPGRHGSQSLGWLLMGCALLGALPSSGADPPSTVPGITEAYLDLTLSSPVAGIVTARHFEEGEMVQEGEIIVELDKRLEELELQRRLLVKDMLSKDLEVTKQLRETTSSVSQEELEKKSLEQKIAAVEHQTAEVQLHRRLIVAPANGAIAEMLLDRGEACQAYQPVLRLVDTRRCYFVANLEAKAAAGLRLNQEVTVEVDNGVSVVKVSAQLVYLAPVVDPASGLLKVKALFDNSTGQVRPGLAGQLILKKYAN